MKNIIDKKLLKFILVGIVNTLVGTAIMFGLYNLAGCSYWVSSAANYVIGSILSYVLNKKFTFQHRGRIAQSALRFTGNIAVCYLLAYGTGTAEAAGQVCSPGDPDRRNTAGTGKYSDAGRNDLIYGIQLSGTAVFCFWRKE